MKSFGDKTKFAIEYGHVTEFYKDEYLYEPRYEFHYWINFLVNGKNLFEFNHVEGMIDTYCNDLSFLIDFFCKGLAFQLKFDPVPAKGVSCKNHHDANLLVRYPTFLDEEDLHEIKEEDNDFIDAVDFNLYKIQPGDVDDQIKWEYHHKISTANIATFLPCLMIARHYTDSKKVEISYQSVGMVTTGQTGTKYYLKHPTGVALIDIKLYKQVVVDFCLDFINTHKVKHPKQMAEYMEKLQKGIEMEV